MITEAKKTCIVLDLDDTLYKEYDYQTSGLKYIEKMILRLYGQDLKGRLLELRDQGVDDIFLEAVNFLHLPLSVKESFLMMYRFHEPDIALSIETKTFLKAILNDFKQVAILTDGRSITQRMKLKSLGLMDIPLFISEEWNSRKPESKRFNQIMQHYSACSHFFYIADNPSKDFVSPNALKWTSVCLRGNQKNVYSQDLVGINEKYLPDFFINSLSDIYKC